MSIKSIVASILAKLGFNLKTIKDSADFESIFGLSKDFEQDILLLVYKKSEDFVLDESGFLVLNIDTFRLKYRNRYSSYIIDEVKVNGKNILCGYEIKSKELIQKLNELMIAAENKRSQVISEAITSILNK